MNGSNTAAELIWRDFGKTIYGKFRKAVEQYRLVSEGDRIAVCISGGKDSMLLALCMRQLQKYGSVPFELEFLAMDPGYSAEKRDAIMRNVQFLDIPLKMHSTKVFESAEKSGGNPCFLCSRLRRGWLYKTAKEMGCNKIALGHHFDDVIETILMGMLYGSQIQTMMPKLRSKNYEDVQVIRPLYLVRESDIIEWSERSGLSFLGCACAVTSKDSAGSKRSEIKELLCRLRETNPAVDMNIFRSVENIDLNRIVSYHNGSEYHHFLDDYDK